MTIFFMLVAGAIVGIATIAKFYPSAETLVTGNGDDAEMDDVVNDVASAVPNAYIQPMTSLDQRIADFGEAIKKAEGYGVKNAIPTKYNNPGDLKPPNGKAGYWRGQTGIGDGDHAIFSTYNDGWNALTKQIRLWATNKSNVAGSKTTFLQLSQSYAENWVPWLANVLAYLQTVGYQVNQNTTLGEYFNG